MTRDRYGESGTGCAPRAQVRRAIVAFGLALAIAGSMLLPMRAGAQGVMKVKMATLVPQGSSWHLVLQQTADDWKRISGGRVSVTIFAGGVAGDDPDVVRKMRLGTLQAGVLTSVGVAEVDRSVYALGVPMMYASYDEVYAVLERLRPELEASLAAKGFIVLNWADGGWVHFFTKKPATTPDELRRLKLFTWAGDNEAIEIWKSNGFQPVPSQATELTTALKTGLVNAVGVPPQVSIISQYYQDARYMTDLPWQLLLGATLISKSTWEQIPADIRPALLESARAAGRTLQRQIRESEARDVAAMQRNGLTVVPVDAAARALWLAFAEGTYPRIRGSVVPAEVFDKALGLRNEYRRQQAKPTRH
jgi:TRAP-type transport system periplasmic protein